MRNTGRLGTCNLHLVRGPVVKSNISEYDPEGMAIQFTKELEN